MAVVSVKRAAELAGYSQNTLFKAIRSGKLSKTADNSGIDTAELIRVYGQLHDVYEKDSKGGSKGRVSVSEPVTPIITTPDAGTAGYATNLKVIELLEAQVKDLQDRADRADSREQQLMELLKSKMLQDNSDSGIVSKLRKLW